ncbi:MAG: ABC transporter substrate-binding protein [Gammaproteobacteria bacterium]|nr:ABC transporter substrate-binding protein [Gammaproteobacteria bacterium]
MSCISIMALRHSAFYSPLLMSVAGGFLKDEGLEPIYTLASPVKTIPDSIANGSCDVAQSAVATGFASLERNVELVKQSVKQPLKEPQIIHFSQINERDGFFIAGREKDDNFQWSKLAGKTILVDHLFQPMATLKYVLHKHGVDYASLNVIDGGSVDEIDQAFRSGVADYVHQQGPSPQQLQKEGLGYVLASVGDEIGPVAFSSLCASREWLEKDEAKAFMRAYRKALIYSIEAPAEEIAAKEAEAGFFPNIDVDVLTSTIEAYKKLGCWQADPMISPTAYEKLLDIFEFNRLISTRYSYDTLIQSPPE